LHSFCVIGYKQNEGLVLGRLSNLIVEQRGDYAKARFYGEQALCIQQELGDQVGEINAHSAFSFIDLAQNNYMAARIQAEQALHIAQKIGYKYFDGLCLTLLGSIADELGEYTAAMTYYQQGLPIFREMGDRDFTGQTLTVLGIVFYHLGQSKTAMESSQQALSIAQETKNKLFQNPVLTLQGHALRELGDLDEAADVYRQALALALELGLQYYAKQAQTGLAAIALARGNLAEAQAPMDEILNYLETHTLSTQDEAAWMSLTCYRILQANDDPRARPTLDAAYNFIQDIAARIDDEALRASFLQNVRANREIVQAWESLS